MENNRVWRGIGCHFGFKLFKIFGIHLHPKPPLPTPVKFHLLLHLQILRRIPRNKDLLIAVRIGSDGADFGCKGEKAD